MVYMISYYIISYFMYILYMIYTPYNVYISYIYIILYIYHISYIYIYTMSYLYMLKNNICHIIYVSFMYIYIKFICICISLFRSSNLECPSTLPFVSFAFHRWEFQALTFQTKNHSHHPFIAHLDSMKQSFLHMLTISIFWHPIIQFLLTFF